MRLQRPQPATLFYVALAVLASAPAWIVRYPPLQDMPFHVAAMRVIHSFHDPHFGIDQYFELTFGRTQYFFYYLLGSLIAYVTGVTAANVILVCVYLGGTPLAIRSLCRAIGKDERLAILSVPLLVNVMFMFGLMPFMFGIPIMFWALASAVRYFDELENDRRPDVLKHEAIVLAALAFVLFFSHVFPFVLFGLGFAAIFPWSRPRDWIRAGAPTVPSLAAVGWWFFFTASGKIAQGAVNSKDAVQPLDKAWSGVFDWVTNIFRDTTDEAWFCAFVFVALLSLGLSQGDRSTARREARLLIVVPLTCFILYFTTGESRGPVWLFSQRFPTLFLLTMVPMLRFPRGMRGWLVTAAALFVAVGSTVNVCKHFIRFQLEEVGDIDEAIEQIPPGKKVAALIYDKYSTVINWAPFLHFGSYYQAQRGGAVEFTYAGYTHWPFDFKPGMYPPQPNLPPGPARPRWEWTPESVSVQGELMPWYDYVLTRGSGFRPPPGTFHQVWHGERWSVWKHD
jgi:hypothetical protein